MGRFAFARVLVSAFLVSGVLGALACATSPTGRRQLLLYNDADLAKMGTASFDQQKQEVPLTKSTADSRYVRCIADAILAQVDPASVPGGDGEWEVQVFDSEQVNAFAVPGNKIGVYRGMLEMAENQSQLAAVMGHEVGHVLARHSNERVSQMAASQLSQAAVAATISSANMSSGSGQLVMAGLGLGAQYGVLLPYSRSHESEADLIGLELMAKAGFDPRQSVKLWENMEKASGGQAPPELASTHPANATRIRDLQAAMPAAIEIENKAQLAGHRPNCRR